MNLPMLTAETESKVREAILHPVAEIRWTALSFYTNAFTRDPDIMPRVIKAVQRYGRDDAGFRLLRQAERLPQTETTVRWMVDELSQPWDLSDRAIDNYCYAAAMVLCNAPIVYLRPEIAGLPMFPEELRNFFRQRFEMAAWDWETGWKALTDLIDSMGEQDLELPHSHRAQCIIESLARHRDKAPWILGHLRPRSDENLDASPLLKVFGAEIAGRTRLVEAAPLLVELLEDGDLDLTEACRNALIEIGGDDTVELIAREWPDGDEGFRLSAAEVLEHVHTRRSVSTCLDLLADEEDYEVTLFLAHALLGHCVEEAIAPVREVLEEYEFVDEESNEFDLAHRLVAVATILGVTFPGYDQRYADAVATNWGWDDFQENRVRNNVRRQYGLEPFDDSDEDLEDELSPKEQRELAALWRRIRDVDPALFERMATPELQQRQEPDYDRPLHDEPLHRDPSQVGRNDPCPCGSGKKFKRCCWSKRSS